MPLQACGSCLQVQIIPREGDLSRTISSFFVPLEVLFLKGSRFLKQDLSEICRNKKESRYPNMTYQDLANASGKSLKNIGQFMRGEILNPGIDTVGPVCRLLHISLDRFFDIHPDDVHRNLISRRSFTTHSRKLSTYVKRSRSASNP